MKPKMKARREARQLYRLCLVDGLLDAGRARWVGGRLASSKRRGAVAISLRSSGWFDSITTGTRPSSRARLN